MLAIRRASAVDAAQIQEIFSQCLAQADWLPEAARAAPDFRTVSLGEMVLVAVQGAQIQGFVSVQQKSPFIHHLYVRPEMGKTGVGRQLLSALELILPTPWRLKCVSANTQALAFYERLGWYETGAGEDEYGPHLELEWSPLAPKPRT